MGDKTFNPSPVSFNCFLYEFSTHTDLLQRSFRLFSKDVQTRRHVFLLERNLTSNFSWDTKKSYEIRMFWAIQTFFYVWIRQSHTIGKYFQCSFETSQWRISNFLNSSFSFILDVFISWIRCVCVFYRIHISSTQLLNLIPYHSIVGAGATEAIVVNPFEVVKVNLQSNRAK